MSTNQSTAFDALTFNSLFDVDNNSNDIVNDSLNSSTDTLTASLQPSSSLDQPLSTPTIDKLPSSSNVVTATGTDSELNILEIPDAIVDDALLFNSNQPNLGDLATNATQSLGALYDDPIEYGTPIEDADYWRQQQGSASCAVVAQVCVYQSLTGQYISEDDASYYAQQQGWFDPLTGTLPANIGNILNVLGIETYQQDNTSFSDLEYALARGDKPIVGLDANEIWTPQYDLYGTPLEQTNAGHAVWVTGIDYESDGSVGIVLNDSGTPSGMASVVDYYDFMNAWQDYGNFVTVADNPVT